MQFRGERSKTANNNSHSGISDSDNSLNMESYIYVLYDLQDVFLSLRMKNKTANVWNYVPATI